MASTRRLARTAMVLAFAVSMVVPAGAALAAPPEHAPAHGRRDASDDGTRSTAAATSGAEGRTGDHPGRGNGRDEAPGQQKKQTTRHPASASAGSQDPGPDRAPAPARGRDGEPAAVSDRTVEPPIVVPPPNDAGAPAPASPAPPPAAAAPVAAAVPVAPPAPVVDVPPAPPASPVEAAPGRRVIWPDLDGPFRDLLRDVTTTIGRAVPRDLGPVREPLAELVPVLLALLGAFLALQRGIGRGLGQLPMVAMAPRHDVVRHGH